MNDPEAGGARPPSRDEGQDGPIPLGQKLLDRPFLLLIAGMVVMFVFFTGWGLVEIASLAPAPLP